MNSNFAWNRQLLGRALWALRTGQWRVFGMLEG